MRALLLAALLSGCGTGTVSKCACKLTYGDLSVQLACGESACLAYTSFGCDDGIVLVGPCGHDFSQGTLADSGDPDSGGACVPAGASCGGQPAPCCNPASGGSALSCDPASQRCCVPTGSVCATSADCCSHACAGGGICGS